MNLNQSKQQDVKRFNLHVLRIKDVFNPMGPWETGFKNIFTTTS